MVRDTGVIYRQRQFSDASLLQTLILGWREHPDATLPQLTQMAALHQAVFTPQVLDQRFTPALSTCLERFLAAVVAILTAGLDGEPVAIQLLQRVTGGVAARQHHHQLARGAGRALARLWGPAYRPRHGRAQSDGAIRSAAGPLRCAGPQRGPDARSG